MAADIHAVGPVMGVHGGPRRPTQPLAIGQPRLPSSALPHTSDLVQLSKSAGTLSTLADAGDSGSVSPPNATPPVARTRCRFESKLLLLLCCDHPVPARPSSVIPCPLLATASRRTASGSQRSGR